jgi:glutathione S-transferase
MDSMAITEFIQAKYPSPPSTLTSPLGTEIEKKARAASGKAFVVSIMPREVHIFSPRSQHYFRMSREAEIGCKLEDMLEPQGKEDKLWAASDAAMREVSDLLLTNAGKGPFILGDVPSASDFFLAGALQSARVVDEGVWLRNVRYEGFKRVYEACESWLEKNT